MLIDGKKIAAEVIEELKHEREHFTVPVSLGVVMAQGDAASASFVRIKERVAANLGVVLVREFLTPGMQTQDALEAVARLVETTAGIIVQLPLPPQFDTETILSAVPASHDVDAINPTLTNRIVQAPVAEAIAEIFSRVNVTAKNKKAVVVGAGRLVGAPAAALLRTLGAQVVVVTESRGSLDELTDADIVVLGAGKSGMIVPSMLKVGVVLIDAGTSEQGGRVMGDADLSCAEVASIFTPVPGGVGPIAVAMIFKNLLTLAKLQ